MNKTATSKNITAKNKSLKLSEGIMKQKKSKLNKTTINQS